MEIDATPLPLRKKARKLKAKSAKARKRSIEAVDKENDQLGVRRYLYNMVWWTRDRECVCVWGGGGGGLIQTSYTIMYTVCSF